MQKISREMVNPRDLAGEQEEEDSLSHPFIVY